MNKPCHTANVINGVSVVVMPDGWLLMYEGKPSAMADVPKQYHNLIKAMVKSVAYDAGYYTFSPPPVPTGLWEKIDWINHVKFDFDI